MANPSMPDPAGQPGAQLRLLGKIDPVDLLESAGIAYAQALTRVVDAADLYVNARPGRDRDRAKRLLQAADAEASRLHDELRRTAERAARR